MGLWLCSDWKVSLCAVFTSLPTWPGDCLSIAIWPSGEPQGLASDVFCCPREFWLLVGGRWWHQAAFAASLRSVELWRCPYLFRAL